MDSLQKIVRSQLFKISSLNSVSVLFKIVTGLVTSKLLALFVGPSGMALVGNMRVFFSSLESIATLGFQNGIVKYIAENENEENQIKKIVATVCFSLLGAAVVLSCVLYFYATFWSQRIFGSTSEYDFVFKVLALALPWYAISIVFIAVLNGLGKFKQVIWINILGNVLGLVLSGILIMNYKTQGALLSVVIAPALLFFVSIYFANTAVGFLQTIRFRDFDFVIIKNLSSYSLMTLFTAMASPFVYLVIRNKVSISIGLEQVGFWETMLRISSYYMLFISTILSIYFLPRLATAKSDADTKGVFWHFYKTILPVFIGVVVVVYCLRFFIIDLLFTPSFVPVTHLFLWQLVGDIFKVASLILGYQFFAKKLTVAFLISELFSLVILYFSTLYLLPIFGIEGVVMAQAFDNFLYLLLLCVYFRKILW